MYPNEELTVEGCNQIIEAAKINVELAEAAERLKANPDFKRIILDGFLKEFPVSLVKNKAAYANRGVDDQRFIDSQLMGVGVLFDYMSDITVAGNSAKDSIASATNEREYILQNPEEV